MRRAVARGDALDRRDLGEVPFVDAGDGVAGRQRRQPHRRVEGDHRGEHRQRRDRHRCAGQQRAAHPAAAPQQAAQPAQAHAGDHPAHEAGAGDPDRLPGELRPHPERHAQRIAHDEDRHGEDQREPAAGDPDPAVLLPDHLAAPADGMADRQAEQQPDQPAAEGQAGHDGLQSTCDRDAKTDQRQDRQPQRPHGARPAGPPAQPHHEGEQRPHPERRVQDDVDR